MNASTTDDHHHEAAHDDPTAHDRHVAHDRRAGHGGHDKHAGHDPAVFRRLFWWNLLLAIPVIVFSRMIQEWFGYSIEANWAGWVPPVIGTVIYLSVRRGITTFPSFEVDDPEDDAATRGYLDAETAFSEAEIERRSAL